MKRTCFILGAILLGGLWLGPLPAMTAHSFAAHMTLHMGVVAIAAPLLAAGLAGTRFDPVQKRPAWFPAVPISILELVVVWGWHAPALHHAARQVAWGMAAEQACFFLTGLLLWLAAVSGSRERAGAGVAALLLTSMHMTLLGALLALTPRTLYAHRDHTGSSLPALDDQHLGGAIMLVVGGVSYLAGGLALTTRLVRRKLAASRV